MLEIGINDGGSLAMWRWYFGPGAIIYGADINNRTRAYEGRPEYGSPERVIIGNQGTAAFWDAVRAIVGPTGVDILVDDNRH